jgi:hypothetical protein
MQDRLARARQVAGEEDGYKPGEYVQLGRIAPGDQRLWWTPGGNGSLFYLTDESGDEGARAGRPDETDDGPLRVLLTHHIDCGTDHCAVKVQIEREDREGVVFVNLPGAVLLARLLDMQLLVGDVPLTDAALADQVLVKRSVLQTARDDADEIDDDLSDLQKALAALATTELNLVVEYIEAAEKALTGIKDKASGLYTDLDGLT